MILTPGIGEIAANDLLIKKNHPSFIERADKLIGNYRSTISFMGTASPLLLYWTPIGVLTTIGIKVVVATTIAAIALNTFEKTKPTSNVQTASLNLLHHFVVISFPFIVGMCLPSYLPASMSKNILVGITFLAASICAVANYVFPPMDHNKIYRRLGLV